MANTVLVVVLLALAYVLSYAPVVRVIGASQPLDPHRPYAADGNDLPLYAPVDWLIDNTPLRTPLLVWADLYGVGGDFRLARMFRESWVFFYVEPTG